MNNLSLAPKIDTPNLPKDSTISLLIFDSEIPQTFSFIPLAYVKACFEVSFNSLLLNSKNTSTDIL